MLCSAAGPSEGVTIRHNDGSAERVAIGEHVRFEGFLVADFERGVWVGNRRLNPPLLNTRYDPAKDADYVCADLEIRFEDFPRMQSLSGFPVSVSGIASPHPEGEQGCPLFLRHVRVTRR